MKRNVIRLQKVANEGTEDMYEPLHLTLDHKTNAHPHRSIALDLLKTPRDAAGCEV
jgi:hypothetical protein